MFHIVLFAPDIPQNTGNIGRLCAFTRSALHLIHPLGFSLADKYLKRAGMDYWRSLTLYEHGDWQAFKQSIVAPQRLWLFTTKAEQSFWEVEFQPGDGLLFGKETAGAPAWLHECVGEKQRVAIPSYNANLRSLNLATSVGIALYEALRQERARQDSNLRPTDS